MEEESIKASENLAEYEDEGVGTAQAVTRSVAVTMVEGQPKTRKGK